MSVYYCQFCIVWQNYELAAKDKRKINGLDLAACASCASNLGHPFASFAQQNNCQRQHL